MSASTPTNPPLPPRIDPTSERGRKASHDLGVICAAVIMRLRKEGKPVLGEDPIDGQGVPPTS